MTPKEKIKKKSRAAYKLYESAFNTVEHANPTETFALGRLLGQYEGPLAALAQLRKQK